MKRHGGAACRRVPAFSGPSPFFRCLLVAECKRPSVVVLVVLVVLLIFFFFFFFIIIIIFIIFIFIFLLVVVVVFFFCGSAAMAAAAAGGKQEQQALFERGVRAALKHWTGLQVMTTRAKRRG